MSNQKLRQARKQRHWTQEQASARIGVAVGTYRRWESGTQLPHPSALALVCEAFNMSDCDLGFPEDLFLQPAESDKPAAPIHREAEKQHAQLPGTDQSLYIFANEQLAAFTTLLRLGSLSCLIQGKGKHCKPCYSR
jgi:transcriptional regulator with XRE-family HTH domain